MRDIFSRACESSQNANLDYVIELLCDLVTNTPGLIPARELLREYETKKSKSAGMITKVKAYFTGIFFSGKSRRMIAENPLEVMKQCEEVLAEYLFNIPVLEVLADAAVEADAPFIAIETRVLIHDLQPDNEENLQKLHTLRSQEHEESSNADADDADDEDDESTEIAELMGQTFESREELDYAITQLEDELKKNDSSFEIRRQLGDFYAQAGNYDKAIEYFESVVGEDDEFDPAIDKYLEKAMLARYAEQIAAASPEDAAKLERERLEYLLARAINRVDLYPDDNQLHYDLGALYFQARQYDEAIEELERGRRNPKRRNMANVYLGRSLMAKGEYALAIEPLREAIRDMGRMNTEKMTAMYYLANAYEKLDMDDDALEIYKEIYKVEISFMDVASRIDSFYMKEKEQGS
jgi:tetratricopeptide (TPR) repeat protein